MNPLLSQVSPDYPGWLPQILNRATEALHLNFNWNDAGWLVLLIWAVVVFTLLAVLGQAAAIVMVLMERKVLAWLTQRKGPNRVGPWGALQTLADGVKLLFKEDIIPNGANPFLFTLGPVIFFIPCFVFYALIPFSDKLTAIALPAGALFVFAISSLSVVGLVLSGWASNNKYSLLGGMRSAAQAISYEIPLVMAVLAVCLFAGSMNIAEIVRVQYGGFWNWFAILLTPVSLIIFFTSTLAEVNRVPFDLPEAESELVSGYNTEYTGMKFALFFLAEYAALFAMSALNVAFFMGGYFPPMQHFIVELITHQQLIDPNTGLAIAGLNSPLQLALQVEMLFWFMIKTYFFIFLAMWVRATLPRLKPDQLMGFSWKFLIPLSLINIFLVSAGKFAFMDVAARNGRNMIDLLPVLNGSTVVSWLIWVVVAAIVFFAFFFVMSRLLSEKLEARLARR